MPQCGQDHCQGEIHRILNVCKRRLLDFFFGLSYSSYDDLLDEVEESTLKQRQDDLTLKFAGKCVKSSKFNNWFPEGVQTRGGSHFFEAEAKTRRLQNSAIPYMTRLLNQKN